MTETRTTAPFPFTASCQDQIEAGVPFTVLEIDNGHVKWTETVCDAHVDEARATADCR